MITCKEIINNRKLVRQSNNESYIYQYGQNLFKAKKIVKYKRKVF